MNTSTPQSLNPLTGQPLDNDQLSEVVSLANKALALGAEIAIKEAALEKAQADLRLIEQVQLPDAMSAIGLSYFQLANGAAIEIKPFYSCSLSEKDPEAKARGIEWLKQNGFDSLVKHEINILMAGKDSIQPLEELEQFLNAIEIPYEDGTKVPAPTLKALMKERIEKGLPFPMDIFKGYTGKLAKITVPKPTK